MLFCHLYFSVLYEKLYRCLSKLRCKTTASNIFGIIRTNWFFIEKPYIYHYICVREWWNPEYFSRSKRLNPPRKLHNYLINICCAGKCFFPLEIYIFCAGGCFSRLEVTEIVEVCISKYLSSIVEHKSDRKLTDKEKTLCVSYFFFLF